MISVLRLRETAPDWVIQEPLIKTGFAFSATAVKPSGAPARTYYLVIDDAKGSIEVREQVGRELLPSCCVERHINPNGTFCVFHNSTALISDIETARSWWDCLRQYLTDQEYANRHQEWPIHRGLSHGDAADLQLKMEALANPLGWTSEVLNGIFRNSGWLGSALQSVDDTTGMLRNQRAPCPRLCKEIHKPTRRADCAHDRCTKKCNKIHRDVLKIDCPNRDVINQIAYLEHERRQYEKKFMKEIRLNKIVCCGTMKRCELQA